MTEPVDLLNRAEQIAPVPEEGAEASEWVRHYAAQALAANAAFRLFMGTNRGTELGYLSLLASTSLAAAVALEAPPGTAARVIWELTPEAGALNGEWVDHLADVLGLCGINPADLYPWFDAKDFTAPLQLPQLAVSRG